MLTGYHIIDRDERPDDEHGKRGSTSYPSRTSWGAGYSLAEKFPFLFERRFGIRAYDYWWGYTEAQIDLMAIDQPLVVYHDDNEDEPHTKKKMDDYYDRWLAKRNGESAVGQKISLGDYLRKK